MMNAFISTLFLAIDIYIWIIIISALISWVQPNPHNPIVQILYRLTAPAYSFVWKIFRPVFGGVDLTPIIIILILHFLKVLIAQIAYSI